MFFVIYICKFIVLKINKVLVEIGNFKREDIKFDLLFFYFIKMLVINIRIGLFVYFYQNFSLNYILVDLYLKYCINRCY